MIMFLVSCVLLFICSVACAPFTNIVSAQSESLVPLQNVSHSFPIKLKTSSRDPLKCEYYNRTECTQSNGEYGCGNTFQVCEVTKYSDIVNYLCYALWLNTTDKGVELVNKGCWLGQPIGCRPDAYPHKVGLEDIKQCVTSDPLEKNYYFCCCSGVKCNTNVAYIPKIHEPEPDPPADDDEDAKDLPNFPTFYILPGIGTFILFSFVVAFVIFKSMYPKAKKVQPISSNQVEISEPVPDLNVTTTSSLNSSEHDTLQLNYILAYGKFGTVWKAINHYHDVVAVKVFSMQNRNSWEVEKNIFMLPQMKHANILRFLGAEFHGMDCTGEFWLITEYHSNGSLSDYLAANTITVGQVIKIVQDISEGLAFLHKELPPTRTEARKPSVCHRDFSSKNILLSADLRACIADFGLALAFSSGTPVGQIRNQVGTLRYMAPECLAGAINFNPASLQRIDIYACGLVIWELLSRCRFAEGVTCAEYRLPFESETGPSPTLDIMRKLVCEEKRRPEMVREWFEHHALLVVAATAQQCWDHDVESRLDARNISGRLQSIFPCQNYIF